MLLQEKALARLPPVAADRHWLDEARTAIHKRAVQLFQDGLGNMEVRTWDPRSLQAPAGEGPCVAADLTSHANPPGASFQRHTEVATALQVFYYLGELPAQVKGVLDGLHAHVTASIKRALDVRSLQAESADLPAGAPGSTPAGASAAPVGSNLLGSIRRVGEPPTGQSALWATALWIRLEKLFDALVGDWQKVRRMRGEGFQGGARGSKEGRGVRRKSEERRGSKTHAVSILRGLPSPPTPLTLPPPPSPLSLTCCTWRLVPQVYLLERVLVRKRDPATGVSYIEFVRKGSDATVVQAFWNDVADILERELGLALKRARPLGPPAPHPMSHPPDLLTPWSCSRGQSTDSTFLQTTFQTQFPRLMQLWASMMTRLHTVASGSSATTGIVAGFGSGDASSSASQIECV